LWNSGRQRVIRSPVHLDDPDPAERVDKGTEPDFVRSCFEDVALVPDAAHEPGPIW